MSGRILTAEAAPKNMPDGNLFDPVFYAQTYPDVASVFGTDENLLYLHYQTSGIAEGRSPYAHETENANIVNVPSTTELVIHPNAQLIDSGVAKNIGLTLPVIGQLGVFNIDGTYTELFDDNNYSVAIANSEGTIVVTMYLGDIVNLNYELNDSMVPVYASSQNGYAQGNTVFKSYQIDLRQFQLKTSAIDILFYHRRPLKS